MNALQNAYLQIIGVRIAPQILEETFPNPHGSYLTLEERMSVKCVRPIILADMNRLSGVLTYINISECKMLATDHTNGCFVIDVPKHLTGGRSIISVLSIVANTGMGMTGRIPYCASPLVTEGYKLLNSINDTNVMQTSRLELVGENKVLIEGYPTYLQNGVLKCNIANNANLENVQPNYYHVVTDVITYGLQAYIYNNLRPKLDVAQLYAGHELPYFKDTVESYADAHELYREQLVKFSKLMVLNDSRKSSQYLSTVIGMMT